MPKIAGQFEVGDSIRVVKAIEGEDDFSVPFMATVRGRHGDFLVVVDAEDDAFCVRPDQIEHEPD